ncbi:hypothetical protein L1887_11334 [Cichorium endivia]|nr:hypothetical protein L1887_11334 [Cichorium endivia]
MVQPQPDVKAFGKGIKDQRGFTEIVNAVLRQTGGFDGSRVVIQFTEIHYTTGILFVVSPRKSDTGGKP